MPNDAPDDGPKDGTRKDNVDTRAGYVLDIFEQTHPTTEREKRTSRDIGITTSAEAIEQVIQRACDQLGEGALVLGVVASTKKSIQFLFAIDTTEFRLIHQVVASHVEVSLPDGFIHRATALAIPEMTRGAIKWLVGSLDDGVWTPLPETELGQALATQRTEKPGPVDTPTDRTTAQTDESTGAPTRSTGPGIPRNWDDPQLETARDMLNRPRTSERLGIKLSIHPTKIWIDKLREVNAGRQIWHATFELAISGKPQSPTLGERLAQLNAAARQVTLTYDGPSYPIEQLGSSIRHYVRQRDPLFYKSDVQLEYDEPIAPNGSYAMQVSVQSLDEVLDVLDMIIDPDSSRERRRYK